MPMAFWCVYGRSADFPEPYVARLWLDKRPTRNVIRGQTLDEVRRLLPMGLTPFPRYPEDAPEIVETWM